MTSVCAGNAGQIAEILVSDGEFIAQDQLLMRVVPAAPMTLRRLFIANRGEIAVRILRTAKRLGLETVLGASDADLDSVPARLADRCVRIGPAPRGEELPRHRGSGGGGKQRRHGRVASPDTGFYRKTRRWRAPARRRASLLWGHRPTRSTQSGTNWRRDGQARAAGSYPIVPGGEAKSLADAQAVALRTGWPILIKAVSGGGGRGLRRVDASAELPSQLELAIAEANAAFGNPRVYVERYRSRGSACGGTDSRRWPRHHSPRHP